MELSPVAYLTGSKTQVFVTIGAVTTAVYFLSRKRQLQKIPGPRGLPLFGNAKQIQAGKPHLTVSGWAKEYGGIMKINLYGDDVVVVSNYEGISEMLVTKSSDFAGRPYIFRATYIAGEGTVSYSDFSPKWNIMKKCAMKGLKQVGDQLTELEEIMVDVIDGLMTKLASYKNESVDLWEDIEHFVYHITFTLVYGHKLSEEEHHKFVHIIIAGNDKMSAKSDNFILDNIPLSRGPWYSKFRELREIRLRRQAFRKAQLAKTISRHQENDTSSAVDGFLEEMNNSSSEKTPRISLANIQSAAMDLTIAGVKTTHSVLYYFIALMASNPILQEEAYQAVIEAIGQRSPTLKDRFSIPYIESMTFEILRLMSHIPFCLPHMTTTDTSLLGYNIPKGTQVWPNVWQMHHDETIWDDPWEFKPRRFLDDSGKLITPDRPLRKQLFAFGAGRRGCAGEMLARNRIFLFMVTMLQRFKIIHPQGEQIKCDPREFRLGIVLFVESFKVKLHPRN